MIENGILLMVTGLLVGFLAGLAVHHLLTRGRRSATEVALLTQSYESKIADLSARIKDQAELEANMLQAFKALSQDVMKSNTEMLTSQSKQILEQFQEGAKADLQLRQERIGQLVKPVQEKLGEVDQKLQTIETERRKHFAELGQQITSIAEANAKLTMTTGNLSSMLSNTKARGRWGEVQLNRVAELAGMSEHCDFTEQSEAQVGDGVRRPDMVVHLPSGRVIIVDSKVPMDSFLEANATADEAERKRHYTNHANALKNHIRQLSAKNYFEGYSGSLEFVVLFLPNEAIYSTALEYDNSLIEYGAENNVILATPTTLIALLKAAAYGWRQETLAKEVEEIGRLGKELYDRVGTMASHVVKLGASLGNSIDHYNRMVGSIETRVLVTARRFKDLKVIDSSAAEIGAVEPIDATTRELQATELKEGSGESLESLDR